MIMILYLTGLGRNPFYDDGAPLCRPTVPIRMRISAVDCTRPFLLYNVLIRINGIMHLSALHFVTRYTCTQTKTSQIMRAKTSKGIKSHV